MINIKVIINAIGIILTIIGVWIVMINSPINFTAIDGGNASTDWNKIEIAIKRKNLWIKIGVWGGIIVGSFIQLIANFLP